jgi:hypothetical protein
MILLLQIAAGVPGRVEILVVLAVICLLFGERIFSIRAVETVVIRNRRNLKQVVLAKLSAAFNEMVQMENVLISIWMGILVFGVCK